MFEMDGASNTSAQKMQLFDVVYTMQVDDLQKQLQGIHMEYKQMVHQTLEKLNTQVLSPYIQETSRNIGATHT